MRQVSVSSRAGRPPRLVIAGGLAAGAAVLVAGAAVGHLVAPRHTDPAAAPPVGGGAAQSATVATPAPAGPTRVEQGVPLGYAHTRDGALMAAAHDLEVFAGPLVLHPDQYRAAMRAMAAPAGLDSLMTTTEEALSSMESGYHLISNAASGLPAFVVSRTISGAVTRYSDDSADVETFAVGVIGNGQDPPFALLDGGTFTLDWVDGPGGGDWRVAEMGRVPSWASTVATFPSASAPRPGFVDLEEVSDAPPAP